MGSTQKFHAVCIPFPAQGHITPMLNLAKLLHNKGFYITFVNNEHNHRRFLKVKGAAAMQVLPDFRFEAIPDGLPPSDEDSMQDVPPLCDATMKNCLAPFVDLLKRLNTDRSSGVPPVTWVVGDGVMSFSYDAAKKVGIPSVMLWTASACGFVAYMHYKHLVERDLVPLKDIGDLSNGYLDMPIDWVPGLQNIRLKDFPSFVRTTDRDDIMLNYFIHETGRASMPQAIIINTFDDLDRPILNVLSSMLIPPIYTVGPLPLLCRQQLPDDSPLSAFGSTLWKEDEGCFPWLEGKKPGSVVLVSFGSITVMTDEELIEFAWGLANSGYDFIWVIRPDLVKSGNGGTKSASILPQEFIEETKERGLLVGWCPQGQLLAHDAIGGFLTHSGWNSTSESIVGGVPMLCWPFFAEQQTNCWYANTAWEIGMEIAGEVRRGEVERLIRELMGGEKGMEMRRKAMELKKSAIRATRAGGSSFENLERLVNQVLLVGKVG